MKPYGMTALRILRDVFYHPTEERLRTPFRLVFGAVALVVAVIAAEIWVVFGIDAVVSPETPIELGSPLVYGLTIGVGGIAVMVTLVPIARIIDRRLFVDYGFRVDRDWWIDCAFGLALGAVLQAGVFLAGWAAGWFTVTGTFQAAGSFLVGIAGLVALFVVVGIYEEALIRGWLLTNLAEGLRGFGPRSAVAVALVASSGLFGLFHAANPGATPLSIAVIAMAGVMLAAGYLLTGELAIPIGIHVTWNITQGGVFGHGVSGLGVGATVLETEAGGPPVWTGGEFGPEGGVLGLIAVLIGLVAVLGWVRYRTGTLRLHPAVTTPDLLTGRGSTADEETS